MLSQFREVNNTQNRPGRPGPATLPSQRPLEFCSLQPPNRLASADTLFNVLRCTASLYSMCESHCYQQSMQLHQQRCNMTTFHSPIDQTGCPVPHFLKQWRSQGRGGGGMDPQSQEMLRVGNRGPITDCLMNIVTKYRGYRDACVGLPFPVLLFGK